MDQKNLALLYLAAVQALTVRHKFKYTKFYTLILFVIQNFYLKLFSLCGNKRTFFLINKFKNYSNDFVLFVLRF